MGRANLHALMRVAAIDIGTNTVLLLIAEVEGRELSVLTDDHAIARLGEGVDKTAMISEAAYKRLRAKLVQHRITMDHFAPLRVSAIATSAMRDAKNSRDIIRRAKEDTGIDIEIISGEEEARWTFLGSVQALDLPSDTPIVVLDIGGGSTELAVGTRDSFDHGWSTQIGAVRLTERAQTENLSLAEASEMVREALGPIDVPADATLIAVAGTPTSLAAMDLGLDTFDAVRIHGYRLTRQSIERLLNEIWDMPSEELVARYPAVSPGRADILAGGTVVLHEAMKLTQTDDCTVSTRGLRYGIALRAAAKR